MPLLEAPAYADAGDLIRAVFQALLPPEKISTAAYAEAKRWIKRPGAGSLVKYGADEAPYVTGIQDALDDDRFLTVAVPGCAQSGKNVGAENWLLKSVAADAADMLWYMQTDDAVEAYVKQRIEPMIEAHQEMVSSLGARSIDNSLHFKRFARMSVEFLGASPRNFVNKTTSRIVADEYDAWSESLGDGMVLMDFRRQVAGEGSKILVMSHPDRAKGLNPTRDWNQGVMSVYRDSDRRTWWWQCPECGCYSSPHPTTRRQMVIDYDVDAPLDEVADMARLACPVHGCVIPDHARRGMNRTGRWVCEGEECAEDGAITGTPIGSRTAGFWILGVMSPFILGGIGGLARAREKARREMAMTGDEKPFREIMVKGWGIPQGAEKQVGAVEAQALVERAESKLSLGVVPEGVRFLTASVDSQGNRFELLTRGWGVGGESWVIDWQPITAAPSTSAADWDDLLTKLAELAYPLADDSGRVMRVRAAGFDSGGQAGVTEHAYAAWRRAKREGRARIAGRIDGRDGWMLVPMKGASSAAAALINLAYPEAARKDRTARARGEVPILFFNPNLMKDALASQLGVALPGPNHVHFPAKLKSREEPHVWFEQLAAERRKANGRWEKVNASARNEVTDLMVMTDALARLHGLHRINWASPPGWAAPWDENSMVSVPDLAPPKLVVTASLPPADAPAPAAQTYFRPRPGSFFGGGRRG
ncbi:terminase gpA endonuclease subunit [Roseococcus pinisoli]|uniref:Phage terminase large subunit family protein n=1 Tax=Roseococcus pinisoli TaxID=2835040 RepID=A0ABS5Q9Z7_9PROT|nr:terminase gpA endonuclease subunit [Roseococcus pinisoli]MBS7810526.1 phage terminase large subunit family protein [Roseococcus pinisoli]